MRTVLQIMLRLMARAVLWKYHPRIVGVTGSVGKTTSKEAIAAVLSARWRVRQSMKSYNNEFGLPLTVLGAEAQGRSLGGWMSVLVGWARLMIWRDAQYPEVLVLEMGADKPGDITRLVALAPCNVGVLTAVAPTHLEQFKTVDAVAREKRKIIETIKPNGAAVLNGDDTLVASTKVKNGIKRMTYGFSEGVDVRATDVRFKTGENDGHAGLSFKVTSEGSSVPIFLSGVAGKPAVTSALAAIAVGLAMNLHLVEIGSALHQFVPPPGRLRLLEGVHDTVLIDDTYNSSPRAAIAAVEALRDLGATTTGKRWAVLGDMLELGEHSVQYHRDLGEAVFKTGIDELVAVGALAKGIAEGARKAGMEHAHIHEFETASAAADNLRQRVAAGDLILIKGSQGARMEHAVEALLKDPAAADALLVRHDALWKGK